MQGIQNSQSNLKKKDKFRGLILLKYKMYYKVSVNKYWHQDRHIIDQWNGTENQEINSLIYS